MRKVKEVLRLRYELGMSYSQIRQSCGVSLGTVNNLLTRAEQAGLTTWDQVRNLDEGRWRSGSTSAPMTGGGKPIECRERVKNDAVLRDTSFHMVIRRARHARQNPGDSTWDWPHKTSKNP